MARTIIRAAVVALLVLTANALDLHPRTTPRGSEDSLGCGGSLHSLMACLPAVEGDNPEPPSDDCCTSIVHIDTNCLCNVLGAGDSGSFPGMNVKAAIELPRECGRVVPQGFRCAGYLIPTAP